MADLTKELFQAAINLRGFIEPADYKRYVLPIIFLRFLSLRFEKRYEQLELLIQDNDSDYYGDKSVLKDRDEFRAAGDFIIPAEARWRNIVKQAPADDIKVRLDNIFELLENTYPDKLRGLLPRIYAGSNLERENVTGLINLFSKDIFRQDYGGEGLLERVYEYFIGEFANSEGASAAANTSRLRASCARLWRYRNLTKEKSSIPAAARAGCLCKATPSLTTTGGSRFTDRRAKTSPIGSAG